MKLGGMNEEEFEYYEDNNPALSKIIQRNIRTLIRLRLQAANRGKYSEDTVGEILLNIKK
ncbi:hypothetical protein [Nostoc sp.]